LAAHEANCLHDGWLPLRERVQTADGQTTSSVEVPRATESPSQTRAGSGGGRRSRAADGDVGHQSGRGGGVERRCGVAAGLRLADLRRAAEEGRAGGGQPEGRMLEACDHGGWDGPGCHHRRDEQARRHGRASAGGGCGYPRGRVMDRRGREEKLSHN
jgi:hypothetical protein